MYLHQKSQAYIPSDKMPSTIWNVRYHFATLILSAEELEASFPSDKCYQSVVAAQLV